jgi:hypothetical protein
MAFFLPAEFDASGLPDLDAQARRATALAALSTQDEDITPWDTAWEFDEATGSVVRGRNPFEWATFIQRLDAEIAAETRTRS